MGDVPENSPQLRVSDRERKTVDDRLMAAVGEGMLTLAEYDERSGRLWQSQTRAELAQLVADLPAEHLPSVPAPTAVGGRTRRVVAVMSDERFESPLAPGDRVTGVSLMGSSTIDLRRADLPDGTRLTVTAVMGDVKVLVPADAQVELAGFSFMGDRRSEVRGGDGAVVRVRAIAVMGSVSITAGEGVLLPARAAEVQRATGVPAPRQARLRTLLAGAALPVVLLGGAAAVVASGTDSRVVFGSSVVQVQEGQGSVNVSTLFGSTTVVVPDDVSADGGGLMLFGSRECAAACSPGRGRISVRAVGGFGSVQILTQTEYDQQRNPRN